MTVDCADDKSTTVEALKILKLASSNSGYDLKVVRRKRFNLEEAQVCGGRDGSIRVTFFLNENMVKISRKKIPDTQRVSTYQAILGTRSSPTSQALKQVSPQWKSVSIEGDDLVGLSWILKMHADKRILKRETTTAPSAVEMAWTKIKFETINKKGKFDLLKYLSIKTGTEFSTCSAKGKSKVVIKGRNTMAKLLFNTNSDTITVSLSNNFAQGGSTERTPDRAKLVDKIPKEEDSEWIKAIGRRVIMHKSTECERLRRICRKHKGSSYPPVEVANIFEHLRDLMEVGPSEIPGADDGLHI